MALDAGSVFAVLGGKFNPAGFAQFDATMKKSSATAASSEAAMSGSFKRSGAAAAAMAATVAQSAAGIQRMPPPATKQSRASPMGPAPKSALAAGRTHTVAAKDTLYGIARRYNVKVEDIVAANPAIVPRVSSPLRVGTALRIP